MAPPVASPTGFLAGRGGARICAGPLSFLVSRNAGRASYGAEEEELTHRREKHRTVKVTQEG